jgi:hypothetical protein
LSSKSQSLRKNKIPQKVSQGEVNQYVVIVTVIVIIIIIIIMQWFRRAVTGFRSPAEAKGVYSSLCPDQL